jgi:antitoxin component of RelBE/YafQ-DinJ toxin-antitoxin module
MERHQVIQLRVSPAEKADAEKKSASIGMGLSDWIRKLMKEWKK